MKNLSSEFCARAILCRVVILAMLGLAGSASSAHAVMLGVLQGSGGNSLANANLVASNLGGSASVISVVDFNATSAADLRADYDVILFGWALTTGLNADWLTKLKPYLDLGGGIIWEDPNNLSDFASAAGLTIDTSISGSGAVTVTPVSGLTDGVVSNAFANNHFGFSAFSSDWTAFLSNSGGIVGLYASFSSGGRMVLSGPDNFYHAASTLSSNQFVLAQNTASWSSGGIQPVDIPEPGVLVLLCFGLFGLFFVCAKRGRFERARVHSRSCA